MIRLLIVAISALVGALAVGLLVMLTGVPTSTGGWVWTAAAFALGFLIARVCLSLGLNTSTALDEGMRQAAQESRGDAYEATGRKAGAVVGKGLSKVARIGAPKPSPARPAPTTPAASGDAAGAGEGSGAGSGASAEVTVDRAARVLGSMVGRRVAERRRRP
ncbi:MAG: hypothetical protein KGR18_05610 [Acidobacteria bacterium]|nr:hypothetical protein [Acidobacteriota bacterium]